MPNNMAMLETFDFLQDLILLDELALVLEFLYSNLIIVCLRLKTSVFCKLGSLLSALTSNPR
jgi:hypothetical protein